MVISRFGARTGLWAGAVLMGALAVGGCGTVPQPADSPANPDSAVERNAGAPASSATLKSLVSVQRIKVEDDEDYTGDEPVLGVIGFEGYVGKPESIDTFMVSRDRQKCYEHGDQDGALWEQGSGVDDGETVDVRDQQGDHEFTVDPYTDDEFMAEGPYVYGIVSLSFDGDHDNACRAYANVSAQQGKLLQELKETIGTMDHKNYTNAKQTMSVAAKRLNQAFGESGDPLWVKILGALDNLGDGDDYVGANMSVFLPAATDLADSLDTPEIVGSSDVYKAAIVKSGQNLTWEGVAENHDDDVRYRLYNYVNLN